MIKCPLCDMEVKNPIDQKKVEDSHANDFYANDFYCPTYVKKFEDLKVSHYVRNQIKYLIYGASVYQYMATVPPFEIVWYTTGNLWVYQYDSKTQEPEEKYHKKTGEFKAFLKTCHRFKTLVPFS